MLKATRLNFNQSIWFGRFRVGFCVVCFGCIYLCGIAVCKLSVGFGLLFGSLLERF